MRQVTQYGYLPNPGVTPGSLQFSLKIGRVQKVNAGAKTIDIVMLDGTGMYFEVPVIGPTASTMSGMVHLPDPHLRNDDDYSMYGDEKRDLYAIIGFVNGVGKFPICLGFRHPNVYQLSFPNKEGFENHYIDRHPGDRYHRIVGDTVTDMGGTDAPTEEELYWPDFSYIKIFDSDKALTCLTGQNVDHDVQPFRVKKEQRKGIYFQHSSGTRFLITPDGQIKISHHTGSWISISPETDDVEAETNPLSTIDSQTNPSTSADSSPVQIHIEHSSGTTMTILSNGDISINGVGKLDIHSGGDMAITSDTQITMTAPQIDLNP